MSLCTLAQLKSYLEIGTADTEHDARLDQLIAGVSARLARRAGRIYGGRPCLEYVSLAQLLDVPEPRTPTLWLAAWPVVSVSEIKEALYGGFTDVTALTANEGYQLDSQLGAIHRIGCWLRGRQTVRATYIGGYTPPTTAPAWESGADYVKSAQVSYAGLVYACILAIEGGTTAPPDDTDHWALVPPTTAQWWESGENYATGAQVSYAGLIYVCILAIEGGTTAPPDDTDHWTVAPGQVALPDDIVGAAVMQAAFQFQRRSQLGLTGAGAAGGSFSSYARDELLPDVEAVMDGYARKIG